MAGTYGQFLHALRREDLAAVLVRRADIHQLHVAAFFRGGQHVGQVGAQVLVGGFDTDVAGREGAGAVIQGTAFGFPLDPPAVEQFDVIDAVHIEHPGTPGGEPVVVVAVEDGGGVLGYAGFTQQRLEVLLAGDVAFDRIDQVGVPAEIHRAGNVPAFVHARHHADLDDSHLGIVEILLQPVAADQVFAGGRNLARLQQSGGGQQAGAKQGLDTHGETPAMRYTEEASQSPGE
ncbi:hypothetical protein D9M68_625470 [compost metagenome]